MPPLLIFKKILFKNSAFLCTIFTCFKMHPLKEGRVRQPSPPLNPPITLHTYTGID